MRCKTGRPFAQETAGYFFNGAPKKKISIRPFTDFLEVCHLVGELESIDAVMKLLKDETLSKEEIIGELHLMIDDIWKEYRRNPHGARKGLPLSFEKIINEDFDKVVRPTR